MRRDLPRSYRNAFSSSILALITPCVVNLDDLPFPCFMAGRDSAQGHLGFIVHSGLEDRRWPFRILPRGKHPGRGLLFLARFVRDRQDLYTCSHCVLLSTHNDILPGLKPGVSFASHADSKLAWILRQILLALPADIPFDLGLVQSYGT